MRSKSYHWPSKRRHWRAKNIYSKLKSKAFHIITNKIWVYGAYTNAKHNIKPHVDSPLLRILRALRINSTLRIKSVNKSAVLKGLQE